MSGTVDLLLIFITGLVVSLLHPRKWCSDININLIIGIFFLYFLCLGSEEAVFYVSVAGVEPTKYTE